MLFPFAMPLTEAPAPSQTQIVFLGTGTPNPDPNHQGPAVAIVVNGHTYLVDSGPGIVRQASAARLKGLPGFAMENLTQCFITHLHSDHTVGLPDLMFTPAVTGRKAGLNLVGPPGLKRMVRHIEDAWKEDREIRFHGGEPAIPAAYKVDVKEVKREGTVYEDGNVKVTAFFVNHGKWEYALGYRFKTADRDIVISGDTTFSVNLVRNAIGCDVLIHEAYSEAGLQKRTPDWQAYHSKYHTSGHEIGRIAQSLNPKLLLLYHELPFGQPAGQILSEVKSHFVGDVREAEDLVSY